MTQMQQELNEASTFRQNLLEHGVFTEDAYGNLNLVEEKNDREMIKIDRIKASKQKSSLVPAQFNQNDDNDAIRSFRSAQDDEDLNGPG